MVDEYTKKTLLTAYKSNKKKSEISVKEKRLDLYLLFCYSILQLMR